MLRYKQFSGQGDALEESVNAWLEANEPDVTKMAQTVGADGTLSLSFLFEESFLGQERRLSSESGMQSATMAPAPAAGVQDEPLHVSAESMAPPGEQV